MNTVFLLMARYNNLAVVPVEWVCRDYFRHLTVEKFLRKVLAGEISLPIVRIDRSQKTTKSVHIDDLAIYLESDAYKALINPQPTALYRHFDGQGCLLYVGVSLNALQRLSEHRYSYWIDRVARVDIERFPSREAALAAEREAIRIEKPLHNIAGRVA